MREPNAEESTLPKKKIEVRLVSSEQSADRDVSCSYEPSRVYHVFKVYRLPGMKPDSSTDTSAVSLLRPLARLTPKEDPRGPPARLAFDEERERLGYAPNNNLDRNPIVGADALQDDIRGYLQQDHSEP